MSYRLLAFAVCVAIIAMVAIFWRLFDEYARGRLTVKSLLVGGMFFAAIFGLFVAGIQTLAEGPTL